MAVIRGDARANGDGAVSDVVVRFDHQDGGVPTEVTGQGASFRSLDDKPNPVIGERYAVARALRHAAQRIERQADGLVEHAEQMRKYRRKQESERLNEGGNPQRNGNAVYANLRDGDTFYHGDESYHETFGKEHNKWYVEEVVSHFNGSVGVRIRPANELTRERSSRGANSFVHYAGENTGVYIAN